MGNTLAARETYFTVQLIETGIETPREYELVNSHDLTVRDLLEHVNKYRMKPIRAVSLPNANTALAEDTRLHTLQREAAEQNTEPHALRLRVL